MDVDYKYHEYREIENEESDADGMLTVKAGNYTRRAELVGGIDSTAQINGNGNTGVDGVGADDTLRLLGDGKLHLVPALDDNSVPHLNSVSIMA